MNLSVVGVKPLESYRLLLTFENGEKRLFDMTSYLDKGVFRELKDKNIFRSVRVVSFDHPCHGRRLKHISSNQTHYNVKKI